MRISDWSSVVCSSDLRGLFVRRRAPPARAYGAAGIGRAAWEGQEQHRADEAQEVGVSRKRRNRLRKQPARLPQPFQRRTTMAVASLSAVHTGITVAQSDRAHQLLQQSAAIVDLIGASLEGDLLPAEHSVPFEI